MSRFVLYFGPCAAKDGGLRLFWRRDGDGRLGITGQRLCSASFIIRLDNGFVGALEPPVHHDRRRGLDVL